MGEQIKNYKELRVYKGAIETAMLIFDIPKTFPPEEKYSMVDQIRRCSRSVCANIAEAWRKRRYSAAFIAKLNDVESEACETQVWIELAGKCNYIDKETEDRLTEMYNQILAQIYRMINEPQKWILKSKP